MFAQRFSVAGNISPLPPLGQYSRYEDQLSSPKGAKALSLTMHFDFPQQFQQIGRALGGIAFVDGNSGLRVFVLRAPLPGTALIDQFYRDVQAMGGGRNDTSSLIRRLRADPA